MRLLPLSCCVLVLLGGESTRIPLGVGRLHQFGVPSGTVIIVIECLEPDDQLLFANCMTGPPYHCAPRRPHRAFVPLDPDDRIDPAVEYPEAHFPEHQGGIYYRSDTFALRASLDEEHSYVCREYTQGCSPFDEDRDGDVDMLDWAERTVRFSHEDRIRRQMGPMRASP